MELGQVPASGKGDTASPLLVSNEIASESPINYSLPASRQGVSGSTGSLTHSGSSRQWNTKLRTSLHYVRREPGNFQSLDYDAVTSELSTKRLEMFSTRHWYGYSGASIGRWVITVCIGLGIGLIAFSMSKGIDSLIDYKMDCILAKTNDDQHAVDLRNTSNNSPLTINSILNCKTYPFVTFLFYNAMFALAACIPTVFFAPEAAGSGIPEVMGYLNGVHIRNFLSCKTLVAKLWGTVLIVASGAAVGPEGPFVHTGAILGSGLTRGHKTCGRWRIDSPALFAMFHNDTGACTILAARKNELPK